MSKLSKKCLTSVSGFLSIQKAGARAIKPGLDWQGFTGGRKGRVASRQRVPGASARVESLVIVHLLYALSSYAYFMWPPLRVTLPKTNSWRRLATMRSPVSIAKFVNTIPTPRFDWG